MDKNTCIIVVLGFIFVILCSLNNNSLEEITNIGIKIQNQIDPIEYTLNTRHKMLNEHPGLKSDKNVLNNYDKTNNNIALISKNYPQLKDNNPSY